MNNMSVIAFILLFYIAGCSIVLISNKVYLYKPLTNIMTPIDTIYDQGGQYENKQNTSK